jgi:hypothetical protein
MKNYTFKYCTFYLYMQYISEQSIVDLLLYAGTIIDTVYQNGFAICNMKSVILSR